MSDFIGSRSLEKPVTTAEVTTETPASQPVLLHYEREDQWWVVITIFLIIFLIALIIISFFIVESVPELHANGGGVVLVTCPTDQCATNRFNGEKRCPDLGKQILSNAATEFCSSPTMCDDPAHPYAVQSDQSTTINGLCEPNTTCRCLANPQCPQYITAAFRTNVGNPYGALQGQRTSFTQFISSIPTTDPNSLAVSVTDNTPITYNNDGLSFCTIPVEWIARSQPGCGFIQEVTAESITTCMGGPSQCDGQLSVFNPCTRGTLAFISNNSDDFTASDIELIPLGCVNGVPCPCGTVAVFDTRAELIVCKNIIS